MSIVEGSREEVRAAALEATAKGADLIEIRLDWLEDLTKESVVDLFKDLSDIKLPKIATIMDRTLFGRFCGSDLEKADLLLEATKCADYVDLGLDMGEPARAICMEELGDKGRVILSWHSDRLLPKDEILSVVRNHRDVISKIVMPANSLQDNLTALGACASLDGFKRIVFCYGKAGCISRVLSPFFGSEWAYASLAKGKEAAPGQLDIQSLRAIQEAFE